MFKINDIEIAVPTKFTINEEEISRSGRTASGKFFNEIIRTINIFNLNYEGITEAKLAYLLEMSGNAVSFSYIDLGEEIVKEVYFKPFGREQFSTRVDKKGLYWKDFDVVLEEI